MTLIEHLSVIKETRSDINQKHDLVDAMFLAITAIMVGAECWPDIETYGNGKSEWLKQYRAFKHVIPKRHTIARILKGLVPETLLETLINWVNENRKAHENPVIALDGKVYEALIGGIRNQRFNLSHLTTQKIAWS